MKVPPIEPPTNLDDSQPTNATREYWCFISYRHADNKQQGRQWATWLHQALETYEVPEDLVGTTNERGDEIPSRIYPVFRDEEELPADAELSAPISRALQNSRFMVVICSPAAVESNFVEDEIHTFKILGKSDRVLAMMIRGEPNASEDAAKQRDGISVEDECFPRSLRRKVDTNGRVTDERTEPVGADFRLADGTEGWTSPEAYRQMLQAAEIPKAQIQDMVNAYSERCDLMKLKIIAGILGVPLGILRDREKVYLLQKARQRARSLRRWLVLIGFLAILAIFAGLFALAKQVEAVENAKRADKESAAKQKNLELASNADLASALKAWQEDFHAQQKGEQAVGYNGKSRWHEAVALLVRALERNPDNQQAALWLYDTIRHQGQARRDWHSLLLNHQGAASFSPDGTRVVTASSDKTARVWDAATGKPIGEPMRHEGKVSSASFSPDGTRVVTANNSTAQVWDAATGKPIGEPLRHETAVTSASFSPDGTRVFTACGDLIQWRNAKPGYARVWDAATGKTIGEPLCHEIWVKSASFSPDGTRVVTASDDNTARVWDAVTGKPIGEPLRHVGKGLSASFSPDGTRVVTACGEEYVKPGYAQVWDAVTGKTIGEPLRHANLVKSASFSPDGTRVVTASWDKTARVWDAATGKPVGEPLRHEGAVNSASFSPDGTRVVTASADNTVRVWDGATGKPIGEPLRHEGAVNSASFSPDGTHVVTASADNTVRVWDAAAGKPIGEPLRHEETVKSASFSPDFTSVVAAWDNTARVWDAATGKPIGEPMRHVGKGLSASFSPDGTRVATASAYNTAHVWDATTGKPIGEPMWHEGKVNSASFSPDGTRVVTTSADNTVRVWDAATGKPIGEPLRHERVVNSASFSPDGTRVVTDTWDWDNTARVCIARVWNVATGKPIGEPMRHEHWVSSASFSPDGTRVVTACGGAQTPGYARVWDAATGKPIGVPMRHEKGVNIASFSPDGTRVVVTASLDNTVRVWDAATGKPIGEPLRHEGVVNSASFRPDGPRVVTASADNTARVWDATTGAPIGELMRHEAKVKSASFSPDGTRVVTASWDNATRVWDAATGKPIGEPLRHEETVNSASFSPDGTRVVTTSADNTVRVWDAATGKPIGEPLRHEETVKSTSFSPDGTRVVTACSVSLKPGCARVWDAATGKPIGVPMHHEATVMSASFSPDGTRVITACGESYRQMGYAQVWDAATGKPIGEPLRHVGLINARFSPDGMRAVTKGYPACQWDVLTHAPSFRSVDLTWAKAIAGLRFRKDGEIEEIPWPERREILSNTSQLQPRWRTLAEAATAPRPNRLLSATSRFTVRQIAERERDFNGIGTVVSLTSALEYDYTLPLARLLLANALEAANATKKPEEQDTTILARAAHLRRYDLDRLPDDPDLWTRAAKALNDAPVGAMVGIGPKSITPAAAALLAAEKALQLKPNDPAAQAERETAAVFCDPTRNEFESALARQARSIAMLRDRDDPLELAGALVVQGNLAGKLNRFDEAFAAAKESLAIGLKAGGNVDSGWLSAASSSVCLYAMLTGKHTEALTVAKWAVALLNHDKPCPARMNLAHAYLFNGQFEKAKAIHAKYLGQAFEDGRKWNDELSNDFKRLREAGQDHPDTKKIEALLEGKE